MWVFLPCIWPPDVRRVPGRSTRREVVIAFDVGGQVIAAERRLLSEEELQCRSGMRRLTWKSGFSCLGVSLRPWPADTSVIAGRDWENSSP